MYYMVPGLVQFHSTSAATISVRRLFNEGIKVIYKPEVSQGFNRLKCDLSLQNATGNRQHKLSSNEVQLPVVTVFPSPYKRVADQTFCLPSSHLFHTATR